MNRQKPPSIIYQFCQAITTSFNGYLSKQQVENEKIWLSLLTTLNHKAYVEQLLFRNYADNKNYEFVYIGDQRIHPEAWVYVNDVLYRKLSLANNKKDKPTNIHELLSFYQKSSLDDRWHDSFIARSLRPFNVNKEVDIFFKPIADIFALQCQRLGTKYGEISKRRRLQYGCYWLRAENNYAEVAEELGLGDVLDALPVPLRPQETPPLELVRVIESLNERYGLLRSCGLPPEEWMTRTELSIDQLKQFKQLLKQTKVRQKSGMDHWPACRDSFEELKAGDIKFIGYSTFDDFYFFYNAETTFSTMHGEYNDPEDCELSAQQCDDDLMHFLDDNPELFNPVTQHAFWRLVVEEIILQKLIKDPHFIDLKNQYPDYVKLSQDQLLKTLQRQLNDIREAYIADGS